MDHTHTRSGVQAYGIGWVPIGVLSVGGGYDTGLSECKGLGWYADWWWWRRPGLRRSLIHSGTVPADGWRSDYRCCARRPCSSRTRTVHHELEVHERGGGRLRGAWVGGGAVRFEFFLWWLTDLAGHTRHEKTDGTRQAKPSSSAIKRTRESERMCKWYRLAIICENDCHG